MDDEPETQAIADARETRDLVIAATLQLALKAIGAVSADGPALVAFDEEYPAGGFTWNLRAMYSHGHSFVRISGDPRPDQGFVSSVEAMARVMGNQGASFDTHVPVSWVELAAKAAEDPLS